MRRVRIVTYAGADPGNLVGRHRSPDTAAANQHTPFGPATGDSASERLGEVRIIGWARVKSSDVENFMAESRGHRHQLFLEFETGVVRPEYDAHLNFRRSSSHRYRKVRPARARRCECAPRLLGSDLRQAQSDSAG